MIDNLELLGAMLDAHTEWIKDSRSPYAVRFDAALFDVNLYRADLREANLYGADLSWANLAGANLSGTKLEGANLTGANLSGIYVNWRSHRLIAEILMRAAGNDVMRMSLAGLVLILTDWCWKQFVEIDHPSKGWALEELRKWTRPGDGAPGYLK